MLKIVTYPTTEPITLTEAKNHLRVDLDYTEDDSYISTLIMVARDYAEGLQRRTLAVTTYELIMDCFPQVKYRYSSYSPIKLEKLPHTSVASITYTLADNSVQTLPVSAYLVKESGEIVPAVGYNWPNAALAAGDAVKVRYTAGYTTETIPPSTKHGLLLLIGHWYENREAVVIGKIPAKVPLAAQSLLDMDRRF